MNKTCVVCGKEIPRPRCGQKTCGAVCRKALSKRLDYERYCRNKDAVKARSRDYYASNAEKVKAAVRERFLALPPEKRRKSPPSPEAKKRRAARCSWQWRNDAEYRRRAQERAKQPDATAKRNAATIEWRRRNPNKAIAAQAAYLTRKRTASLLTISTTLKEQLSDRPQTG